jgi:hypothetical protein
MMRYFFHYRDQAKYFPDGEGSDFDDLAAAEAHARISARELLGSERGESDPSFLPGSYEISDEHGQVLAIVRFDG